jgi:hypothetical protein
MATGRRPFSSSKPELRVSVLVARLYGIYDLAANSGWVSVGVDHDTAAFAVNNFRQCNRCQPLARFPGIPIGFHQSRLTMRGISGSITMDC